jgi:TRAP-type uncharacterized transport system substrate-binding protein
MEALPPGANFKRCKLLWEIGIDLAGDPAEPYHGNRDMLISVGKGSGDRFTPSLRMATGAPHLAYSVANGDLDVAIINPSGLLTQAYRGTGMFKSPLPVRILANYPSWDRFVFLLHPRTGLKSLGEIKEKRYPLRLSIREDTNHPTRVLIEQTFALYGFSIAELESWGGSLQLNKGPGDSRRLKALQEGSIDAIMDEGIIGYLIEALEAGMQPVAPEPRVFEALTALGWRKVSIPPGIYRKITSDYPCIDFSGWPVYTRASMSDQQAYRICAAIHARRDEIPWEEHKPWAPAMELAHLGQDTPTTPRDVPLHPGAERWYREQGIAV